MLTEYKNRLIQKRYIRNTQNIYCKYFRDFSDYFKDEKLEEITTEQINTYILELVQTKNISISQQNQRINASIVYSVKRNRC